MSKTSEPRYAITTLLKADVYMALKALRDTSKVTIQDVVVAGVAALAKERGDEAV